MSHFSGKDLLALGRHARDLADFCSPCNYNVGGGLHITLDSMAQVTTIVAYQEQTCIRMRFRSGKEESSSCDFSNSLWLEHKLAAPPKESAGRIESLRAYSSSALCDSGATF